MLATQHFDHAFGSDQALHRDRAGPFAGHFSNDSGIQLRGIGTQDIERHCRLILRNEGYESPLIGHVNWIKPENFTGALHIVPNRYVTFIDRYAGTGLPRYLDQCCCQTAAGQVPETMYVYVRLDQGANRAPERRAIAFDLGLECQPLPLRHYRNPVPSYISVQQDSISRLHTPGGR